jgi:hypothetical protein
MAWKVASPLIKSAEPTVLSPAQTDTLASTGGATNGEALKWLARLGILGAAGGGAYAAGRGMMDMMKPEEDVLEPRIGPRPMVVRLRKQRRPTMAFGKAAEDEGMMQQGLNWMLGQHHQNITSKPYFMPAAFATTLGAGYGAKRLVEGLIAKHRKDEQARLLNQSKDRYQKALMSEFDAGEKIAATDTLEYNLDVLAKAVMKKAMVKSAGTVNDWGGALAGGYMTGALGLGTLAALQTYNWAKDKSPAAQINKAIKQRERMRWLQRPPEIYFVHDNEQPHQAGQQFGQPPLQPLDDKEKAAGSIARLYH